MADQAGEAMGVEKGKREVETQSLDTPRVIEPSMEEVRFRLAKWILIGYFCALALQLLAPVILLGVFWKTEGVNRNLVQDMVELTESLISVTSVFGGLVGVAVGFYFRS